MTKISMVLVNSGMGGFLNPPGHPEHNWSLQDAYSSISLSAALESDDLDDETKEKARLLIAEWENNKPALSSGDVQDWILQVLGYFRGCYQGFGGSWDASDLTVNAKANPMAFIEQHAGVHCIRQYYPCFVPTIGHFKNAFWGKKV